MADSTLTNLDSTSLNGAELVYVVDGVDSRKTTVQGIINLVTPTSLGLVIGTDVSAQGHNHTGTYEPVDATILRDADIGVSLQAYDVQLSAIAALTGVADSAPYFTGVASVALMTVTSFIRTVLDDANANAVLDTLAGLGLVSATFGANSIAIQIRLSATDTLLIQGGTGSLGSNTTGSINFPTAYATAPVCIVDGGTSNTGIEGDIHSYAAPSISAAAIVNSGSAGTYNWLAIGKA